MKRDYDTRSVHQSAVKRSHRAKVTTSNKVFLCQRFSSETLEHCYRDPAIGILFYKGDEVKEWKDCAVTSLLPER